MSCLKISPKTQEFRWYSNHANCKVNILIRCYWFVLAQPSQNLNNIYLGLKEETQSALYGITFFKRDLEHYTWPAKKIENQLSYSPVTKKIISTLLTHISKWGSIICMYSQHMLHYLIRRSGKFLITRTRIVVQPQQTMRNQEHWKQNWYERPNIY